MLPAHIKIIFTTAYSEYAVESYEIQAVDYLVKPISLERFTKSVSRVLAADEQSATTSKSFIPVKSGYETFRLDISRILFLEKDGNYMNYHYTKEKILARETIQESLNKLPETFIQVHKSFIVNTTKIVSYDKNVLIIGNEKIPISDSFRNRVLSALEK
jgi:DNA-binding LytR/AlgR family response regulator